MNLTLSKEGNFQVELTSYPLKNLDTSVYILLKIFYMTG